MAYEMRISDWSSYVCSSDLQITARPDLIQLIERHGLYASERKNTPLSEILDEMRSAISLTPAETSTGNGSENRTIALELAFEYSRPDQTQAVTQDLDRKSVV